MIFMRDRGPKERHDAVAHDLVDRALIAVDGCHHPFQHGIKELPRLLRIAIGKELQRTLHVGEEHGHLLALAFEGGLGGEDLLGQMWWGI
jgi:hypothetical protein